MPNIISSLTNIGAMSAQRYLAINTDAVTRSTETLASGSRVVNPAYDPASAAVGYSFAARIGALQQASFNVTQATSMLQMVTSVLGSTNALLTQMRALTAQANTNTLGSAELAMLDQTYQQLLAQVDNNATINSRWGEVSLLVGSGGTYNASTANLTATAYNTIAGASLPANTIAGVCATNFQGLVSGAVEEVKVITSGAPGNTSNTAYTVSVKVGNQIFQATTIPTNSAFVYLTSTTDPNNIISYSYAANSSGITNATIYEKTLNQMFGLTNGLPATFQSNSTNLPTTLSVYPGTGVTTGTYVLSYSFDSPSQTGTFRLSNGQNVWSQSIAAPATGNFSGTVTFNNGMQVTATNFVHTANMAQNLFTITGDGTQTYNFQVGDNSQDIVSATFPSVSTSSLGLAGTTVANTTGSAIAANALTAAIQQVSNAVASIGGVYTQLTFVGNNLQSSIQNQVAAKSTFTDTDVANTMIDLQNSKGLQQIAGTVFSQAVQNSTMLADLVQQGSR